MNVTRLLRSILGDIQVNQAKRLELKVGQLVSGTVLRWLNEQEALANIQGIVLKAKLAAPLKPGQTALLQVQPESTAQQVILKPVETSCVPITEESAAQMLRSLGIPDDPPHRQLVRQMFDMEVPLTKENIQKFAAALSAKPAQAAVDEWIRAAFVAFQRNLPLSGQTIQALHSVLGGPPLHQSIGRLKELIDHWQISQPAKEPAPLIIRLQQSLAEVLALSARISGKAGQIAGHLAGTDAPDPSVRFRSEPASQQPAPLSPGNSMTRTEGTSGNNMPAVSPNDHGKAMDGLKSGVSRQTETEQMLSRRLNHGVFAPQLSGNEEDQNSLNQQGQRSLVKNEAAESFTPLRAKAAGVNLSGRPEENGGSSWIVRLLKTMGFDYEQQIVKLLDKPESGAERGPQPVLPEVAEHSSSQQSKQTAAADNLKSLLIQLQAAEDIPAAVKEQSQQLLQQLTGQQLLMANDRSSMFTHVTLFLPIVNEQGEQTAGIHIHSKKGRRGEIDAENCRLIFVLQMKTLGDMMVDVTVTNNIVSLQIHNDHPQFAALLERGREEIAERLSSIGYTFSSLKFVPLAKSQSSFKFAEAENPSASLLYVHKAYKGVDLRI